MLQKGEVGVDYGGYGQRYTFVSHQQQPTQGNFAYLVENRRTPASLHEAMIESDFSNVNVRLLFRQQKTQRYQSHRMYTGSSS